MKPALTFSKVCYRYDAHTPVVVHDMYFSIPQDSFTAIVGPSGGGKSTVLKLAIGLIDPSSGKVENTLRTRMIFQNGALLPWRTVQDNVALGLTGLKLSRRDKKKKIRAVLEELGIQEFAKVYPRDLSGGQRQRVGIARALVSEPEMLFLDEPFSALDVETTMQLATELLRIRETRHVTMLMVSHSIEDAVMLADRVLVVSDGRLVHDIPVHLSRPRGLSDPEVLALSHRLRAFFTKKN